MRGEVRTRKRTRTGKRMRLSLMRGRTEAGPRPAYARCPTAEGFDASGGSSPASWPPRPRGPREADRPDAHGDTADETREAWLPPFHLQDGKPGLRLPLATCLLPQAFRPVRRANPTGVFPDGAGGPLVVPENGWPQHTIAAIEHDEPMHLAGEADARDLSPTNPRERRLRGLPPILRVLLGPPGLGRRKRVGLLGSREHLAFWREPERLHTGRPDVEPDEDCHARARPAASIASRAIRSSPSPGSPLTSIAPTRPTCLPRARTPEQSHLSFSGRGLLRSNARPVTRRPWLCRQAHRPARHPSPSGRREAPSRRSSRRCRR